MSANAFSPQGNSAALAVTATSTAAPIQVKGNNNNATQRMFYNGGTKDCFICGAATSAGAVAVVPTAGSPSLGVPIPAGAIMALTFAPNTYFAAICAGSDTTTLYITPGEGN
jgi:hypothetical protein